MKARPPSKLENILDTDPGQIILRSLNETDYRQIRLVNYSLYQFFNSPSPTIVLTRLEYHFAQVPNEEKAEGLLRSRQTPMLQKYNLNLLDIEFEKVVFPLYTVTNVTLLQLVHGAGDIEMRDNVLKPLFIERYGSKEKGIEEMQKQISEMKNFHKGFDFGPILQAISNELFNLGQDATDRWILSPAMLAAIEKFNKEYDESQPKAIDKGMQFRWETLQEFSDAYAAAAAQWNNNYYLKCALSEDVVLSRILCYATKNDKQRFNQGLYHLQKDNKELFKRMQKTRDGHDFDAALKKPSLDFVLDSSCLDIVYGCSFSLARLGADYFGSLQNFCRTKTSSLPNLCSHTHNPNRRGV